MQTKVSVSKTKIIFLKTKMFSLRKHLRNESVFETKIKLCFVFFQRSATNKVCLRWHAWATTVAVVQSSSQCMSFLVCGQKRLGVATDGKKLIPQSNREVKNIIRERNNPATSGVRLKQRSGY